MDSHSMRRRILSSTSLAILFASAAALGAPKAAQAPVPPVLTAMQEELDRSMDTMSKADPPAYFISYTVADRQYADVSGSNGALLSSIGRPRRAGWKCRRASAPTSSTTRTSWPIAAQLDQSRHFRLARR